MTANLRPNETYWIRATTRELGATGSYRLTISIPASQVQPHDLGIVTRKVERAREWLSGECNPDGDIGTLCRADYQFELFEADTVRIDLDAPAAFPLVILMRVSRDGRSEEVTRTEPASVSGPPASLTATLASGTYRLTLLARSAPPLRIPTDYRLTLGLASAEPIIGRITVRSVSDERIEVGFQVEGQSGRLLPTSRVLRPTSRWWYSSNVMSDGKPVGRIGARLTAGASVELALFPHNGSERLFPNERFFNPVPDVHGDGRWRRSSSIEWAPADKAARILATRYAPILLFSKNTNLPGLREDEKYLPVGIEAMLDHSKLMERRDGLAGLASDREIDASPTELTLEEYRNTGGKHYLEIADRDGDGHEQWWMKHHSAYPNVVYSHVTEWDGKAVIQYWLFYVYNDAQFIASVGAGDHEGDWEGIQLVFDKSLHDLLAADDARPTMLAYAAHEGGHYTRSPDSCLRGVRPAVYVAYGSHAAYFTNSVTYVIYKDVLPVARDRARGGGPSLRVATASTDAGGKYHLRLLTGSEGWLHWLGRWGDDDGGYGLDKHDRGPLGPRYKGLWRALADTPLDEWKRGSCD